MLILFDIDGTLLLTHGAGIRAMADAASELAGRTVSFEGIEYAGSLDPLIWKALYQRNELDASDVAHDHFRARYRQHFARRLADGAQVDVLPGVLDLLDALSRDQTVTVGLVTGNYPETGRMKIEAGGVDFGHFVVYGWGSDGAHRRELPPVAIGQYEAMTGTRIPREQVVIIGDTPHDVDCARQNGCRSLAVATGKFDVDSLTDSGGDLVVSSLASTDALLDWMFTGRDASANVR